MLKNAGLLKPGEASLMQESRQLFSSQMQQLVSSLVPKITDTLIDECSDEISEDFIRHRLPPPGDLIMEDDADNEDPELEDFPFQIGEDEVVELCDPSNIFILVQVIDGVQTLALAHNLENDRLAHMGHPLIEIQDASSFDGDQESTERISEEFESNIDDESDPGLMSLFLPLRFGPLILALKQAFTDGRRITPRSISELFATKYDLGEVKHLLHCASLFNKYPFF